MSEEKLYAVKNDEGKYWDFKDLDGFFGVYDVSSPITACEEIAKTAANDHGGHVVVLTEEPKKAVLSKEEAEIVEKSRVSDIPATYISDHTDVYNGEESLLIEAYVNGYTVAKEKKYNVKVPHTDDSYFYKIDHETCNAADSFHIDLDRPEAKFTKLEIEHYHLQDWKKEEVTDDGE